MSDDTPTTQAHHRHRHLLWIDAAAGTTGGLVMAIGATHWARRYRLPPRLVRAIAAANLTYAASATSLAARPDRSRTAVRALAMANAAWGVVCLVLVFRRRRTASAAGLVHLVGEALIVGVLAVAELRSLDALARPATDEPRRHDERRDPLRR